MADTPALRRNYALFRTFATRWRDNDVFGHMNNVVHYEYVDTAVNLWLIESGALSVLEGETVCVVARSGCVYHGPLGFPAPVEVGLRADRVGRSAITYGVGLFAPGAEAASAEAHFTHVCVARATMRPVPIPDRLRQALERLRA